MIKSDSSEVLRSLSHIKIGESVRDLYFPESIEELYDLYSKLCKQRPFYFVGGGSNTFFGHLEDTVLISERDLPWKWVLEDNILVLSANHNINYVIKKASKYNLGGLEFLAGIPAHLGGLVIMNAGAYHKCIGDYVKWIKVMDENGVRTLKRNEIHFAYRHSDIKGFVLEVALELESDTSDSLNSKILEKINERREKQPLTKPNLGCFFKNGLNYYSGKLIDDLNLKGYRIGDAMVSLQHANFLINNGKASFEEMNELIKVIKDKVFKAYKIELELEVRFVSEK